MEPSLPDLGDSISVKKAVEALHADVPESRSDTVMFHSAVLFGSSSERLIVLMFALAANSTSSIWRVTLSVEETLVNPLVSLAVKLKYHVVLSLSCTFVKFVVIVFVLFTGVQSVRNLVPT